LNPFLNVEEHVREVDGDEDDEEMLIDDKVASTATLPLVQQETNPFRRLSGEEKSGWKVVADDQEMKES